MRKNSSTNSRNREHVDGVCPMGYALSKIGSRWKPLILFKLMNGPRRFAEIKAEVPPITDRMLILSLRELGRDGLVHRHEKPGYPKQVDYSLTESAKELNARAHRALRLGRSRSAKRLVTGPPPTPACRRSPEIRQEAGPEATARQINPAG